MAQEASLLSDNIIDLKNFEKIKDIQDGAFGSVYSAREKGSQNVYAVKILKSWNNSNKEVQSLLREVSILSIQPHPTLIPFRGFSLADPITGKPAIVTLFEPGGSLFDLMAKERDHHPNPKFDYIQKIICLYGISEGMAYLHSKNVIHRDLKPGNILLNEALEPIITDFGLSKIYKEGEQIEQSMFGGTLQWMAPELFKQDPFDTKVDVYAYGMIVYEVLTTIMPFGSDVNQYTLATRVINGERPEFPKNHNIPAPLLKLITDCWSADPKDRPTFTAISQRFLSPDFLPDVTLTDRFQAYVAKLKEHTLRQSTHTTQDESFYQYGMRCLRGDGVLKNEIAAAIYVRKAAEMGNSQAMVQYGKLLKSGTGVVKDEQLAIRLFSDAAARGNPEGQYQLGLERFQAKDFQTAFSYFYQASQKQFPGALYMVGYCYYYQKGAPSNQVLAKAYFLAAADQDCLEAMQQLHSLGLKDELQEFALKGKPNAEYYFALLLLSEKKTVDAGMVFLKRAADHGVAPAMFDLALYLIAGKYVVQNPAAGVRYLKTAADRAYPNAQYEYGRFLVYNTQPYYRDEGIMYLKHAQAQGFGSAKDELIKLQIPC